jgi:ABC-2 type transport system ATP-binding protein
MQVRERARAGEEETRRNGHGSPAGREGEPPETSQADEFALNIQGVSKMFHKADAAGGKAGRAGTAGIGLLRRVRPAWRSRQRKRVVDNVTLQVRPGEVLGVLGPNGCGKSTLVRMVSTLLIPDEGRISVLGHDVVQRSMEVRRLINRVSVDAAFFKKLSAMENLLYSTRLYSVPPVEGLGRAREILKLLGFEQENLDNSMEQLSRGQQQKVAIARAFMSSPALLLLDEPTTGLDPKSKKDVAAFLQSLRAGRSMTILLTTHDMNEAELLCDRIAILNRGRLVALGTADELKAAARADAEAPLPSLEDVFIALAGKRLEEADEEEAPGAGD